MSPRAACRLVALGCTDVHDYVAGKVDWFDRNLSVQGSGADAAAIGRKLRHDVVTSGSADPIADVRERVVGSPYGAALVTAADGVLLGRLRRAALDGADAEARVEAVMELGPSTLRPHQPVADVADRLADRGLEYAIVTDPDGRLLGTVHLADLV